jgi:hypothetical protein
MLGNARNLLLTLTVLATAAGSVAPGQEAAPLPAPRFLTPSVADTPAAAPATAWPLAEYRLPEPAAQLLNPQGRDPILDVPNLPPPGWYVNVEAALIGARFNSRLSGPVTISPTQTDTVVVPTTTFNLTGSPRFELGYRVPKGFGEFLIAYRFLATQGAQDLSNDQGPFHLKSRLDLNVIDLDYANRHILLSVSPRLEMRWRAGIEVLTMFIDSRADATSLPAAGGLLDSRLATQLAGAGPHVGMELCYWLNNPGLAFYGRCEGASLWVHQQQSTAEVVSAGAGAAPLGGLTQMTNTNGIGMLGGQLGLCWTPSTLNTARFFLGYQFTWWAQVGRNASLATNGDLTENGFFARGEFSY